jgi:translation initiation factor IF-1
MVRMKDESEVEETREGGPIGGGRVRVNLEARCRNVQLFKVPGKIRTGRIWVQYERRARTVK